MSYFDDNEDRIIGFGQPTRERRNSVEIQDKEFEIDLEGGWDETPSETPEAGASRPIVTGHVRTPAERLSELLEPYGAESVAKARSLVSRGQVEKVKTEGQSSWYNVAGSKLYVVKVTNGEDFLFAECSCPNGQHRGGDATCYHSIAARVIDSGLDWKDFTDE